MSLWAPQTTGKNTYARVPSRKSSTPPDWDFQTPPPSFQTLEKKSVTENAMLLAATNKQ